MLVKSNEETLLTKEYLTSYLDEKLSALIGYMDARFEKIENRLGHIESRLDKIEARLDGHDIRFDQIDEQLININVRLDGHDVRFIQMDNRFDSMDKRLNSVEDELKVINKHLVAIDERLDSHEERFDRLEKHIDFKFDFFKEDIVRSLEPMFADMRIDLLGYKDSMVSRTMDIEIEQVASTSIAKRNQDLLCDHEVRIKKLEVTR